MPSLHSDLPAHISPHLRIALEEAASRLRSDYGDRLRQIVLYGSRARGDAIEDSDVDLLVVLEGPIENSYQEVKHAGAAWGDLLERYGLSFSFQPYTEAEYQAQRRPFIENVHREGIEL